MSGSSSVWYGVYRKLVGDLDLDVVLSNHYLTRLIAKSKKKTDRFDAHALADLLREGYPCVLCLASKNRRRKAGGTLSYKNDAEQSQTEEHDPLHTALGINQDSRIHVCTSICHGAARPECWRIEEYLKSIDSINGHISSRADFRINSLPRYGLM